MSTNFNTCFIDSNGLDVSSEFVEKSYLLDVYPNLIDSSKAPSLWTWGFNNNGQLGNNTTLNTSSPVQTVSGGTNWKQISASGSVMGGVKSDGTLWVWGNNSQAGLGDNSRIDRSSPVQTVSGGTNWKQVSVAVNGSGAIKTDGTLWLWGTFNVLGNNTSSGSVSSPVQTVSGGTKWKQVSVSNAGMVAAIKTDGTLWTWGNGACGSLGNNTNGSRSSPVQTVSGGTNWKCVTTDVDQSGTVAAIKTDGTLWMWGQNSFGQLGDITIINRSSPVQTVSGGTNWKQVSTSGVSGGIKTDGTLWLWGCNSNGAIGDNTTVSRSSPVQTVSGGTNWKQVATSTAFSGAIKTDGTLWMWGINNNGNLGDNGSIRRSSPVQTISGGTNWKQVVINGTTMAIREEGDW